MDTTDSASALPSATHEKTSRTVSEYLKAKDEQWRALAERKRPLTLLELPIDILRLIVKEITHTNDLTALALTNSALYTLAVPLIYSRFDIVWPDGNVVSTESKSVDALTYGLSTLSLGSAFARTTRKILQPSATPSPVKFAGNEYAKYTRKFSLGNGPNDWVAEYMINKESGKMLGTLVAIAVAKMKNLETFIWDMPTGVLSDIFMGLSSLGDQPDGECKLNRVWIRWHDNSADLVASPSATNPGAAIGGPPIIPPGSQLTPIGILLPADASHPPRQPPVPYADYHCEYPTFSVLPPLKSLTVLDIDELGYLDEIAVLIERSKDSLKELRVGISAKAAHRDFVQAWDGAGLRQIDHRARWPGESTIGERRLGGVLGVLVSKIYDIRKRGVSRAKEKPSSDPVVSEVPALPTTPLSTSQEAEAEPIETSGDVPLPPPLELPIEAAGVDFQGTERVKAPSPLKVDRPSKCVPARKKLDGKLKLETLELERVPLSMQVCRHAIDWSTLTNLTLLDCAQHENLWKVMRKQFQPTSPASFGESAHRQPSSNPPLQYHLALKNIHTDVTTPALIQFIKETLAPNTLEVLFLQDRRQGNSHPPVPIDFIFKGALKRHRSSLQKLLLDSSVRGGQGTTVVGDGTRWRNWTLTTEIVLYITSGRMSSLKELAVSLEYKDWHSFLQRLPNMTQLRSINIPHVADYVAPNYEPRELALQIADIITLRPEIRLCYVGIGAKCFEILEARDVSLSPSGSGPNSPNGAAENDLSAHLHGASGDTPGVDDEEDTTDEDDDEDQADADDSEDDEDVDDDEDDNTPTTAISDPDETQSDNDATEQDDESDDGFIEPDAGRIKLRLREILFYDDKVAIFRARHGRL